MGRLSTSFGQWDFWGHLGNEYELWVKFVILAVCYDWLMVAFGKHQPIVTLVNQTIPESLMPKAVA